MPFLRRSVVPLLLAAAFFAQPAVAQKQKIQLENLGGKAPRISFLGEHPARWAEDGKHVSLKEADGRVLIDPATGEKSQASGESKPQSRPGGRRAGSRSADRVEYEASPDGKLGAFVRKSEAFAGSEDLVVEDGAGGNEWLAAKASAPGQLFGHLDWVYQEEVYGRGNFKGFWWSPDSKWIAFLGLAESDVKDFAIVDHLPASLDKDKTVAVEPMKYPKAGDPNPTATLEIADVAGKKSEPVKLEGYEPDVIIARVAWDPSGMLIVQIQNRIQSWLDVVRVDPATRAVTKMLREESKSWVDVIGQPEWLKDGSFLWLSDRTGYRHVYHHDASGKIIRALTAGEWAVRDLAHVDEEGGWIYFTATKDGSVGDNLYRAPIKGGDVQRITQGRGTHSVSWNADHTFFIDTVSTVESPAEQRLVKADGMVVRQLGKATVAALEKVEYVRPVLEKVAARDGFALDAMVIPPLGLEEGTKYPVWIETYSGPDSPSVRDAWNGSSWFQFLAQNGYFVFQVNVRTSAGMGLCTTSKCYRQFGVQELADLEDALSALLRKYPQADPARVGITGWSFGGFMTAYALTHSKMFKLGIAGAGVYDWRLYDTIYTERYMDTPQNNPEGYKKTSVIEAAKDLSGHLVLVHGTMDDNVHFQNTVRLAYELEKADKQFDVMIYPKSRHGLSGPNQRWHLQQFMWRHMQAQLGGPVKKG